jgi:hypothetical protein
LKTKPMTRALNAPTIPVARRAPRAKPSRRAPIVALLTVLVAAGGLAAAYMTRQTRVTSAPMPDSTAVVVAPTVNEPPPAAPVDTARPTVDSLTPPPLVVETRPRPIAERGGRGPRAARVAQRERNTRDAPAPQVARLTVASEPYGTLFIDGVEVGDTPIANYSLPVGRRVELRVERDGFKTKRESIMISGPNPVRRRYILEPAEQP